MNIGLKEHRPWEKSLLKVSLRLLKVPPRFEEGGRQQRDRLLVGHIQASSILLQQDGRYVLQQATDSPNYLAKLC